VKKAILQLGTKFMAGMKPKLHIDKANKIEQNDTNTSFTFVHYNGIL
jgi:hypothetical protein